MKDVYEFELPEYMYTREGRALSEPYDEITELLKQEVYVSTLHLYNKKYFTLKRYELYKELY